ncbi:hypothetical protein BU26DRAFT_79034 [Trematosphaeria pertusa]|uniref:F-box domain-containing protein n=1 Tax=Trematosphaeria pertusa TaxID=390896 RepID=A0A6A6I6R9_9PLEO|nr:uncharacterized protein BU26DRAFT_79034 [Trematosphaeria pertusa]KAF2245230.1 hypothetical protein BU26DRAFT_79034 [Trematosphaeria pertusa]
MAPSTSASRPFSFFRLPVELQLRVLRCDPFSTLALIRASNSVRDLFQTHSNSVLRSLLHLWPPQLRHLIRTLLAVRQGLLLSSPANKEDIRQLYNRYLEPASGHPEHIDFPPLQTLKLLCTLTLDIDILSQIIVHRAADVAAKAFRAPAIEGWPPLTSILSQEELHRIERAILWLLLYFQLRRHKPGGAYFSLADVFIGELSSWEIEEWFTAVNFVCYFVYHVNESEFRPLYNQYSFRSFFKDISLDSFLRAARSIVEFSPWHSLRNAINEHLSCA